MPPDQPWFASLQAGEPRDAAIAGVDEVGAAYTGSDGCVGVAHGSPGTAL